MELHQRLNVETEETGYEFVARSSRKAPDARRPQTCKSHRTSPQLVDGIHRRRAKRITW